MPESVVTDGGLRFGPLCMSSTILVLILQYRNLVCIIKGSVFLAGSKKSSVGIALQLRRYERYYLTLYVCKDNKIKQRSVM